MPIKERLGVVVSDKMDKTIVVSIENRVTHKRYGKIISKTKRYKVHDQNNECQIGDYILIEETRPLSKTKRWKLKEVKQKSLKLDTSEIGE
jgi:small subunit ribosomal protein S17|uniref:Small ribosomal subunit protein uS17c n=1 Tax=Guillardia theta TaxID=55529 RepID=A0A0U2L6Q8_GUITH|nr:ribosomal protein S17 [Guillardia theta]|tara:strand:+ start:14403 stop:14675 length:273 start_codon:yes stop_codon:yes gene_type:complete